jgi:hypothetical protein
VVIAVAFQSEITAAFSTGWAAATAFEAVADSGTASLGISPGRARAASFT